MLQKGNNMRRILPSIILVENVQCHISRTTFSELKLDHAARLILVAQCVINPLIVRRSGFESYILINGYFEYWSAVRAREIDPKFGESINAFIIETDEEETTIRKQIELFR